MMLICPLCGDVRVVALHHLMTHIRVMHADDPNFMIQCSLQGCKRTFRKFTVYRNHVYAFHDISTLHDSQIPDQSDSNEDNDPGEI